MLTAGIRRRLDPWRGARPSRPPLWRRLSAAELFVASFALLVLLGTLGLRLVPAFSRGAPPGWLDALFMATSAACVTGLVVLDPVTHFTFAGQAFLLLLIQLGGLGMITFTTLIILALGRRLSLRQETLVAAPDVAPHVRADHLARSVVRLAILVEGVGAVLLYLAWIPRFGWTGAIWPAVFHSVSAFCNAGFALFSDSLVGFQRSPVALLVVMALIVAGGLGAITLEESRMWLRARRERRAGREAARLRISLHSRIVLISTAVLVVAAWIPFAIFEWEATLASLPPVHKLVNALFLSVTPRTAGFASIDYSKATDSTNFLTMLLMFVGGSPGSTAGGVKTTTVALVLLLAWSRLRGREETHVAGRTIPEETIQRAVGLMVVATVLVAGCIFLYTFTERTGNDPGHARFLSVVFESVSAFNTVGLSLGVTPTLSTPGRWITILLMFVGRVGPLTFAAALALAARRRRVQFRYAREDVVIG